MDSDSEEELGEDHHDTNVEQDPGVVRLKELSSLNNFGIEDPRDFVTDLDKASLLKVIEVSPVQKSVFAIKAKHVKSAQDILNLYEAIFYFEDMEYTKRFKSLKNYSRAPEEKRKGSRAYVRPPQMVYDFVSDESSDDEEEIDEYYGRRKKVYKPKLPHNLMIKNQKKEASKRTRLPNKQFKVNV